MSNSIAPGSSADVNVNVTALTTNPNVPVQYKTIILKKNLVNGVNTLTQEMMSATNTKYVIKYDYVLGENITIPANCILEFDGGSIIGAANCTLTMNDCYLQGLPKFNNVVFAGTIKNDIFDVTWIENGNDIGAKVNYAQVYFKRLFIPEGDYDIATPIVVNGINKIEFNGYFNYTGSVSNGGSAIEIVRSQVADVFINSLSINKNLLDHRDERTINFIGLCITSSEELDIKINRIQYFNENVRFQDTYAVGCTANKIFCQLSNNANVAIRFTDLCENGEGWCNESVVLGGRYTRFGFQTDPKPYGKTYGVVVAGTKFDEQFGYYTAPPAGYASRDSSSNVHVCNSSFEHLDVGCYFRNVNGAGILWCREEFSPNMLKVSGYCRNFTYNIGYFDGRNTFDLSEATDFYYQGENKSIVIPIGISGGYISAYNNIVMDPYAGILTNFAKNVVGYSSGVIVKNCAGKSFVIRTLDKNKNDVANVCKICKYLTKGEGEVYSNVDNMDSFKSPNINAEYDSATYNGFIGKDIGTINVPDNVDYIFIGICATGSSTNPSNVDSLEIICNNNTVEPYISASPISGAFADKPSVLPIGIPYFAKDLNKNIYAVPSGNSEITAAKWIEEDGNNAGIARTGTFANKPHQDDVSPGFMYYCTDKQTSEGASNGIYIVFQARGTTNLDAVWTDMLGRRIQ